MIDLRGTWKEVVALVAIAGIAGTLSNVFASPQRKVDWIGDETMIPSTKPADTTTVVGGADGTADTTGGAGTNDPAAKLAPEGEIEIDTASAFDLFNSGALFLDARPSHAFYDEGRIANARSFAVWEGDVDDKVGTLMGEFAPDQLMVTYCTGGDCTDSHLLRDKLMAAQFSNVKVFKDGFPSWQTAGHPVEK